jgi:hypothetical protein
MKTIHKITVAVAMLMLLNIVSKAQWTNNPRSGMSVVTNEAGSDKLPTVTDLADNRFLTLWVRYQEVRGKFQVVDQDGFPLLETSGHYLISGTWYNCTEKYLFPDGQGGAICIFEDWRSGFRQIYGQRIDSDGNRLWGENGLPLAIWGGGSTGLKDVTIDSLGNGFFAWSKNLSGTNEIYIQKFNILTGDRLWGEMGVLNCVAAAPCDYQQIVEDNGGGVMEIWEDARSGSGTRLYSQHLDANGNALWTPNGIPLYVPGTSIPIYGTVQEGIPDGQGGGIWSQTPSISYYRVFRLTGTGTVAWSWTHNAGSGSCDILDMLLHPQDGMVWVSGVYATGTTFNAYLYHFDPITGEQSFGVNGLDIGGECITPVNGGVILIDHDSIGNLLARRINLNGIQIWQSIIYRSSDWYAPCGCSDGWNGMVVAFEDYKYPATYPDISAQRVLANGRLGTPHPPDIKGIAPAGLHLSVRPNPFNPTTTFTFTLPEAAKVTLEVFDTSGRRVGVGLDPTRMDAGTHEIIFDGSDLPSGVYLYHLQAGTNDISGKLILLK